MAGTTHLLGARIARKTDERSHTEKVSQHGIVFYYILQQIQSNFSRNSNLTAEALMSDRKQTHKTARYTS